MFLLLALPNGTPEQLQKLQTKTVHAQILWIGENIVEKYISANPVCGTNIKAPEPAVKGTPQKQLRIP